MSHICVCVFGMSNHKDQPHPDCPIHGLLYKIKSPAKSNQILALLEAKAVLEMLRSILKLKFKKGDPFRNGSIWEAMDHAIDKCTKAGLL